MVAGPGALTAKLVHRRSACSPRCLLAQPAPTGEVRQPGQGEVALDRMLEHQALHVPVLRHQRDAALDRQGGLATGRPTRRRARISPVSHRQEPEYRLAGSRCVRCRSARPAHGFRRGATSRSTSVEALVADAGKRQDRRRRQAASVAVGCVAAGRSLALSVLGQHAHAPARRWPRPAAACRYPR